MKLPNLMRDLVAYEGDKRHILESYFIDPLKRLQEDFNTFAEMVTETLDVGMANMGEFVVKASLTETLQGIFNLID